MKVFRKVTPGRNPDIEIHEALTEAENRQRRGALRLDRGRATDDRQLAMLQQFLRTASDGWDLALASVRNLFAEADLHADEVGGDFAGEAERLGGRRRRGARRPRASTSRPSAVDAAARGRRRMRTRLDGRWPSVPAARAARRESLDAAFARLGRRSAAAAAQRVHGDLHLGQTLRTVQGWKLVDFEGEPAKPLAERVLPDSPWRDVAGMLRSFDYAAQLGGEGLRTPRRGPVRADRVPRHRVGRAQPRRRSSRGYVETRSTGGSPARRTVLVAAYKADKAVYEVVYEARNRPAWLTIPLGCDRANHLRRATTAEADDREPTSHRHRDPRPARQREHGDPHALLGPAPTEGGSVVVRAFQPLAESVVVVHGRQAHRPEHEHEGVWAGVLDATRRARLPARGHLRRRRADALRRRVPLPPHARRDRPAPDQRGPPRAALAGARRARARLRRPRRSRSPAPRSRSGRRTPRACGSRATSTAGTAASTRCGSSASPACGSSSCPASARGAHYKFVVLGADGQWREKADPMAFHTEVPPAHVVAWSSSRTYTSGPTTTG